MYTNSASWTLIGSPQREAVLINFLALHQILNTDHKLGATLTERSRCALGLKFIFFSIFGVPWDGFKRCMSELYAQSPTKRKLIIFVTLIACQWKLGHILEGVTKAIHTLYIYRWSMQSFKIVLPNELPKIWKCGGSSASFSGRVVHLKTLVSWNDPGEPTE